MPCFFFVRLWARCSRTFCTFRSLSSPSSTCAPCSAFGQRLTRDTVPLFAIFNACSAPDYLFVSNTLRSSASSFSAFAVCSLASHLFASKKQCSRRTTKHNFGCAFSHRQTAGEVLTYFVYAPLRMLAFRDFQRLLCVCLSLVVVRLWRGAHVPFVRSAPRSRLSRLLPFALWQVTSLQAKKQCSRRTTKARRFAVLFDIKSVDKRCVFRLLFYIRGRV